jgi:hypothetical protein
MVDVDDDEEPFVAKWMVLRGYARLISAKLFGATDLA